MSLADDSKTKVPPLDLDRVNVAGWPQYPFPLATRPTGVPVVLRQSALNALRKHSHSRTDVEVCGVLVGNGYQDETGAFVYVEASIRGEHAGNQLAQVTFTAETWTHIQSELEREYPGRRIMGWYHTHPGFGIFLSPMDLFIHENFFNAPDQLALVYDPLSVEEGVFVWRQGEPRREPVQVEPDVVEEDHKMMRKTSPRPMATAAGLVDEAPLAAQLADVRRRQRLLTAVITALAIVSVAWPVVLRALWVSPIPSTPPHPAIHIDPPPSTSPEGHELPDRHLPAPAAVPSEKDRNGHGQKSRNKDAPPRTPANTEVKDMSPSPNEK